MLRDVLTTAIVQTSTRRMRVRIGDVLEGYEGSDLARVEVRYIGRSEWSEPYVVCRSNGNDCCWTFQDRDWKKVKR